MRKFILNLLVFTLLGISSVMAQFTGTGTSSDPYLISNEQDLQNLATAVNAGESFSGQFFKQTADIDFTDSQIFPNGFTPIGNYIDNRPFSGTYDGDGHSIVRLSVDGEEELAMFAYVYDGCVKNINMENVNILVSNLASASAIVARANHSTFSNITASGQITVTGDMNYVILSGIVGHSNDNTISGCVSMLSFNVDNVSADSIKITGITMGNATISNCLVSTYIKGEPTQYFPIADAGTISKCIITESNIEPSPVSASYVNCYFDHQNTLITEFPYQQTYIDGLNAKATTELTTGSFLNDAAWVETAGLYPRPATVANTGIAMLAAAPMTLNSADCIASVASNFTVSTLNNVLWQTENENLQINGSTVIVNNDEEDSFAEIYAYKNNLMKTLQVNILGNTYGSKANPILISTLADLYELAAMLYDEGNEGGMILNEGKGVSDFGAEYENELYFLLTNDITIPEDSIWVPIGSLTYPFRWNFDGGNHTIDFGERSIISAPSYIDEPTMHKSGSDSFYGTGLFGTIISASISNLTVNGILTVEGPENYGGIAGVALGSVLSNCRLTGSIVYSASSSISGPTAGKSTSGVPNLGGIVGDARYTSFYHCTNAAALQGIGEQSIVGGIAGNGSNVFMESCTNLGRISGEYFNAAMIAMADTSVITGCANYALVNSEYYKGSFVGYVDNLTITDCADYSADPNNGTFADYSWETTYTNDIYAPGSGYLLNYNADIIDRWYYVDSETDPASCGSHANCYVDKQMLPTEGNSVGINKVLTSELISGTAESLNLDASKWTFINGRYPVPSGTEYNNDIAILATTPLVLAATDENNFETAKSVCSSISINQNLGITWMLDTTIVLTGSTISLDSLRQDSTSANVTITARKGNEQVQYTVALHSRAGSADNPLLIESLADFNNFSEAVSNSGTYKGVSVSNHGANLYFKLTTNLVAEQNSTNVVNLRPVGYFSGNFNGGGHTITVTNDDLYSTTYSYYNSDYGLFCSLEFAKVDSINIVIVAEDDKTNFGESKIAILAKSAWNSTISNCTITTDGNIRAAGGALFCGALYYSKMFNCSSFGSGAFINETETDDNIAGLVFDATSAEIKNCANNLTISSSMTDATGILCTGGNVVIENCLNNANITATEHTAAGILLDCSEGSNTLKSLANHGSLTGDYAYGIYGGSSSNTPIENCLNSGKLSGTHVAGIAKNGSNFTNCANYGELAATEGRAAGIALEAASISNSVVASKVSYFYNGSDIGHQYAIGPNADDDNFFDEQITEVKVDSLRLQFYEHGNARTTETTIGNALANDLPANGWDFTDGLYPLPAGLNPNEPHNKLARLPIILRSEGLGRNEKITSVITDFTLPQIDGVTWETSDEDVVAVPSSGGVATVVNQTSSTTVIITASCEGVSREYMFKIHELQGTSADNPYIISTANDFIHMGTNEEYSSGGYGLFFRLNNSIVIRRSNISIDDNEVDGYFQYGIYGAENPYVLFPSQYPFRGTLDGNGNTVTWQNAGYTGTYYGLFKYTDGATISNLSFYYNESGNTYNYSGTLVGNAKATTIKNCSVFSNLAATDRVGGIVDVATDGTVISGCVFAGELSAKNLGGIVADAEDTRIDNSVSMLRIGTLSNNTLETASAIVNSAKNNVEVDSCLVIGDNYDENIKTIGNGDMAVSNCYYDNQMWLVGESDTTNNIIGKPTREIIGNGLFTNSSKWAHVDGKYPVPAGTQYQSVGRLASVPMLLNENDADVMHVTSITPYEADSISWTAASTETNGPINNDFAVQCVDSETETAVMLSVDDATIGSLSFERKLKVTKGIVEVHAPLDDFPPCEGGEISYSVVAGDATYMWTVEPEMEASAFDQDSITLYVPADFMTAYTDNSATLNLTVSYDNCEKDFEFQFNVTPSPAHFSITNDTALCSGSDFTIKCTIDSTYAMYSDMFMFRWYDANDMQTPLQSDTAKTFYIPSLNADKTIKVVIDNGGMCEADTLEVRLTTISASNITVVSGEPNQQICEGEPIEPIVFSVTDPIYTLPYGIYAEYDTANSLLTLTGHPMNSDYEAYTISACGNDFNGLIDVTYRREGITNQSQVVNLGEEVNMNFYGGYNLENIISWESLDGSETFTTEELGLEIRSHQDEEGISSYIEGTAEMPGEYIFHITIPAYENCPSVTYDNFLGVYDNSDLIATALDTTICTGETATLTTIERPGAYGGDYVWTIGNDTIGSGDRIDVVPQQTTIYNVLCGGKRMVGEFEIGDYVYWDENLSESGYSMQKYFEYSSYQNGTGFLIVNIEEDSLLLMTLARTEEVLWSQAPEILASDDVDLHLPSADEFGYVLNNYVRFYKLFSENSVGPAILTSTEKDDNTIYVFNTEYGLMMEYPKTEPALAMGFKKIGKNEVANMVGRTSNITRSGSVEIIVSERQSVDISTNDLLCNTETANVAVVTEYPVINWYNLDNPDEQVVIDNDNAILTDGHYIAVASDIYGSCLDTVPVKVRDLTFEIPQDTTACDSVAIRIAKENVVVLINDEAIEGQTVVITESGTYTVAVYDPENADCREENQIVATINNSYITEIYDTITNDQSYLWNGDSLTIAGNYSFTGTTVNGCDSIVNLHLMVIDANLSFVISGMVTGVDGIPLENVEVSNGNTNTLTDIDGLFSLIVARNNPSVKFIKDDYNIVYMDVEDNGEELLIVMEKPEMELQSDDLQVSTFPYVANEINVEITNNGDGPLTWSSVIVSDNINIVPSAPTRGTRNMWDVVNAEFTTHSRAEQAVATDGFYIYTASWMRKGEFNRYTLDGYVETFNIQGVGAIRNLTYDGSRYFYATDNSNIIYKIDMGAQTVDSIVLDQNMEVRYCAYVSENVLYVGNWTSLYMIVLGETITTVPMSSNLTNVYGIVYDKYHEGGPCLWAFSQISQNNGPSALIQMLDSNGMLTDVTHYVNDTVVNLLSTSTAGGICVSELLYDDKYVMLANIQNSTENNKIVIYEIGKKEVWLSLSQKSGVIPAGESVIVKVSELVRDEGNYAANIKFMPAVYNPNDISLSLNTQVSAPQCSSVMNFVAETDTFHVVNMTWNPIEADENESVSYLVYEAASMTPLDTVYGTSYTINEPSVGNHCYQVRALVRGITDCVSAASETACIEIEALPCNEPLISSVRSYAEGINITWNRLGGVEYYDIYRGNELLAGELTGISYTDTTAIPETEYCYKVVANFVNNACEPIESDNICSRIVSNICNEAPVISVEMLGNVAMIKWTKVGEAQFYSLYRDGMYVTSTSDSLFLDVNLEYETEYCYTIEIACNYGIYNLSETVCANTGEAPEGDGIDQITADDIDVYPNPASGMFYISGAEIKSLTMSNSMGQVAYSNNDLHSDSVAIDVEGMSSGVYALMIELDNGEIIMKRIVVR